MIANDLTRHQVFLQRLITTEFKAMIPIIMKAQAEARKLIDEGASAARVTARVTAILKKLKAVANKRLLAVAEYESDFVLRLLKKSLETDVETPRQKDIKKEFDKAKMNLGINTKPVTIDKAYTLFAEKKGQDVGRIVRDGKTQDDSKNKTKIAVGLLVSGLILTQARALVGTAVNKAANVGRASSYHVNKKIIPKVVWRSVLDDDVCPYCEDLNGDIMPADDFYNLFPAHSNCRCHAEPVLARGVV